MAKFVFKAPVCRALVVLFIAIKRPHSCISRFIIILYRMIFPEITILILNIAVLIADARIEVVALAALGGVVEAK